jgi:hypothetical protein
LCGEVFEAHAQIAKWDTRGQARRCGRPELSHNVDLDSAILLGKLERIVEGPPGMVGAIDGSEQLVHVGSHIVFNETVAQTAKCSVFLTRKQLCMGA